MSKTLQGHCTKLN